MVHFKDVGAVLGWHLANKPARQVSVNLFEPEYGSSSTTFNIFWRDGYGNTGYFTDKNALWNFITIKIQKVLKYHGLHTDAVKAFRLMFLLPRDCQLHMNDIAKGNYPPMIQPEMRPESRDAKLLWRGVNKIRRDLREEFVRAEIIKDDQSDR